MMELPPLWKRFPRIHSTNDSIHEAAREGAPEGTTHLADRQTRGRGRQDRPWWDSPGSSVLFSTLLRPRIEVERTLGLSLVAGKAARQALARHLRRPLQLYWPNDLYLDARRKVGGILCEMRQEGAQYWIALGIGINLDFRGADIPSELRGQVACLGEMGYPVDSGTVTTARRVLEAFWPLYERFQAGESLASLVDQDLAHVGQRVTVHDGHRPAFAGVVSGLGTQGELLVRDDRGVEHAILAGDVIYE